MEYLGRGDLARYAASGIPDMEIKEIAENVLRGLEVMHREGFTHRDIKPQNILVYQKRPEFRRWWVKIADFGISKQVPAGSGTALHTTIGTEAYMAPEILDLCNDQDTSVYSSKVDMWSLGCVLFNLGTCGKLAFSRIDLMRYCDGMVQFNPKDFPIHLSDEGEAFVRNLLKVDQKQRPSAAEALQHPWLTMEKVTPSNSSSNLLSKQQPSELGFRVPPNPTPAEPTNRPITSHLDEPAVDRAKIAENTSIGPQKQHNAGVRGSYEAQSLMINRKRADVPPITDGEADGEKTLRPRRPSSDVTSGSSITAPKVPVRAADDGYQRARAEWSYKAQEDNEISFSEGDILFNIEKVDLDWWLATDSRGQTGLVPRNYLRVMHDAGNVPSDRREYDNNGPKDLREHNQNSPRKMREYDPNAPNRIPEYKPRNDPTNLRKYGPNAPTGIEEYDPWPDPSNYKTLGTPKVQVASARTRIDESNPWSDPSKYANLGTPKVQVSNDPQNVRTPPRPESSHLSSNVDTALPGHGFTARAKYGYEASDSSELSFPEEAIVTNVEYINDDWWYGVYNGRNGVFPAVYVELLGHKAPFKEEKPKRSRFSRWKHFTRSTDHV